MLSVSCRFRRASNRRSLAPCRPRSIPTERPSRTHRDAHRTNAHRSARFDCRFFQTTGMRSFGTRRRPLRGGLTSFDRTRTVQGIEPNLSVEGGDTRQDDGQGLQPKRPSRHAYNAVRSTNKRAQSSSFAQNFMCEPPRDRCPLGTTRLTVGVDESESARVTTPLRYTGARSFEARAMT